MVHRINAVLRKIGDEFAREFPGAVMEVTQPPDRDRPWVLHAYFIEEGDLNRANTRLAELLVDAEDSCGDAVGIAHSKAATEQFYAERVARLGTTAATRRRTASG
jgi:hypothetical protein